MNRLFIYCDNQSRSSGPVELERFILSLGTPLASEGHFWIIETERTPEQVRDALLPWFDGFDPLLIGGVGPRLSHGCWMSQSINDLSSRFTVVG
jgi:hypothetical protein